MASIYRRHRSMAYLAALVLAGWAATLQNAVAAQPARMTTERLRQFCTHGQYMPAEGRFAGQTFDYLLFEPQHYDLRRKYPLIVWLHGYGAYEFDPMGQIKHFELLLTNEGEVRAAEFFLLAVQCPEDPGQWFTSHSGVATQVPQDPGDVVILILRQILQQEPINPLAVTLVGISGGGGACWEMALRNPDQFAAICPLSGGADDPSTAPRFRGVPVWAFHNASDFVAPIEPVRAMIDAINASGGSAYLTEAAGADHNSWQPAFERYNLLNWLLAQEQGRRINWAPPGHVPWIWWQLLAQIGLPILIVVAFLAERRRRRRAWPAPVSP